MNHSIEMERLRDIGIETTNSNVVHYVILNLSAYGCKSIPIISEIIENQPHSEVRIFGMQTITKLKQGNY